MSLIERLFGSLTPEQQAGFNSFRADVDKGLKDMDQSAQDAAVERGHLADEATEEREGALARLLTSLGL